MFSFLKNLRGKDLQPNEVKEYIKEESVLPVTEALSPKDQSKNTGNPQNTEAASKTDEAQQESKSDLRSTELSLHQAWELSLTAEQKYSFSFMAAELPPIKEGNITLAGISLIPHDEGIEIAAFIRNGTPNPVTLNPMNLVVLIKNNELFARQAFDLTEIGEIPPYHARPWSFVFKRENFVQVDVLLESWKLAFELAEKKLVLPQQLELEESWIKTLSDDQKESLIQLAKQLPPLNHGEVNIQCVQLIKSDDGSFRALLLFRNGSDNSLDFHQLPLALYDATGEKVAEGIFELGDFTVNANTSKPWMFIFPPKSIVKVDPDFSRWRVQIPQG